METMNSTAISFRPVASADLDFLRAVYASTRQDEMALTGWSEAEIAAFLDLQFSFQHRQWLETYKNASFAIVLWGDVPVGRLYIDQQPGHIRIIDLALLTEYRRRGIGRAILTNLINEADRTHCILSLHVEMNNPILSFYGRLGFQKICERGIHLYLERQPLSAIKEQK